MQIFPIIPHDLLPGYESNEHIDWTDTTRDLTTSGIVTAVTLVATSAVFTPGLGLYDTDVSHYLSILWNEDDAANRTFNLTVDGANRTLALHADLTVTADCTLDQTLATTASPSWVDITATGDVNVTGDITCDQLAIGDDSAITDDRLMDVDGSLNPEVDTDAYGMVFTPSLGKTNSNIYAMFGRAEVETGMIATNAYGLYIGDAYGGTVTTNYGIYIANIDAGTTNYAIYSVGGNAFFGGNVGINEVAPQDKLEVNGKILVKDKLCFTQDDRNEYIDSLADGYMDYGATTGHRFNTFVEIVSTTDPQLRLTHTDTDDETDFYTDGDGDLHIEATGHDYLFGNTSDDTENIVHILDGGADNKPGALVLYDDGGNPYYLWVDSGGELRGHTAYPTDDDADGVVIADLAP